MQQVPNHIVKGIVYVGCLFMIFELYLIVRILLVTRTLKGIQRQMDFLAQQLNILTTTKSTEESSTAMEVEQIKDERDDLLDLYASESRGVLMIWPLNYLGMSWWTWLNPDSELNIVKMEQNKNMGTVVDLEKGEEKDKIQVLEQGKLGLLDA